MPKTKNWQWYNERLGDYEYHAHAINKVIYSGETKYQQVGIVESPIFGKMLILDGDTQSSQLDEFIYHESLVQPAMILHPNPKKVLILGGGEGATLYQALLHKQVEKVVMIDIDEEVVNLCVQHMPEWSNGAIDSKRAEVIYDDAKKYVETTNEKFDVIISDLTEPLPDSPSCELFSVDFFKKIKNILNPNGIFVLQASQTDYHMMELHTIINKTLREAFKYVNSFEARVPAFDTTWSFIMSSDYIKPFDITKEEIDLRISSRMDKEMRFYDGITHTKIFSLPKFLREAINKQEQIIKNEKPPVIAYEMV